MDNPFYPSWGSYPSIFNIGHRAIRELMEVPVHVEEKVDGSQFSFGYFPGSDHELRIRSKGVEMNIDAPVAMFNKAAEVVRNLREPLAQFFPGFTFRGEYLAKPKHNALAYDRTPHNYIIIFDIQDAEGAFLSPLAKALAANILGLGVVPHIYTGVIEDVAQFRTYLDTTSILGGQKIEGVVIKPVGYSLYGQDKKVLMGKFVSEHFREVHKKTWGESNPSTGDILQRIAKSVATPARWDKAVIHLRERGLITDSPKDIGLLIKEVQADVKKEEMEYIKDELLKYALPHIIRASTHGLPEYYKQRLLEQAFEIPEYETNRDPGDES